MYRLYEIQNENGETLEHGIGGYDIFKNGKMFYHGKVYSLIHVLESKSRIIFTVRPL